MSKLKKCVKGCDIILHIAAFVSPAADYHLKQAMKVNYGSTRNLINAIYELRQEAHTRFVYIGTVAETGDRTPPPIHWGRVGYPIKPSIFDKLARTEHGTIRFIEENMEDHFDVCILLISIFLYNINGANKNNYQNKNFYLHHLIFSYESFLTL